MRAHFSADFWRLLQDARATWVCFEQIGTFPFPPLEKRHISIKRVNIDHRLLSYTLDHPFESSSSPIQEVVRLAIIVYSSAHYNVVQPSSRVARALILDLKEALEWTDLRNYWCLPAQETAQIGSEAPSDNYAASNVLLWVLFLGAHISLGQSERAWFVAALCKVRAERMGQPSSKSRIGGKVELKDREKSWYAARRVLMGCYWSDRVFLESLKKIWNGVETLAGLLSLY